jgi:hypothetical protein
VEVKHLISIPIAAAIGAAAGAVTLGAVSAAHGDIPGLTVALQHIPGTAPGYSVVSTVASALTGGAAGGGIGAAIAAAAKGIGAKAAAVAH